MSLRFFFIYLSKCLFLLHKFFFVLGYIQMPLFEARGGSRNQRLKEPKLEFAAGATALAVCRVCGP